MKYLIAAALLAGCQGLMPSAEQLKAMEGTSSSMCVQSLIYGSVHITTFGGKAVGTAGGGGVAKCANSEVLFDNDGRLQTIPRLIPLPPLTPQGNVTAPPVPQLQWVPGR